MFRRLSSMKALPTSPRTPILGAGISNGSSSLCIPLGEEKNTPSEGPARAPVNLAVKRLVRALGLDGGRSFHVHGRCGWYQAKRRNGNPCIKPSTTTWTNSFNGRYGIAVSGLETTRVIVLDVDFHDIDPRRLPSTFPRAPWQSVSSSGRYLVSSIVDARSRSSRS
jgi:hypothetical protein